MIEEIIAGLKNAMVHGASLEQAMQSFINAGYNPIEVRQAAQSLLQGATTITNAPQNLRPAFQQQNFQQTQQQPQKQFQQFPQASQPPRQFQQIPQVTKQEIRQLPVIRYDRNRKSNKNLLVIIILTIILLMLLGMLIYIIFFGKEFISSLFSSPEISQ